MKNITLIILIALCTIQLNHSQKVKFGKVSKEELEEEFYPLDSSANAAVLFKNRRTHYQYFQSEGFKLITKIHERIKIYNQEGFEWATKEIKLYNGGEDETVSIKAYTFNLTDNKVEKVKLKSGEIFKEQINKYWYAKKFTMPNLKSGSVVEWEYTISSPYIGKIDDVVFQYDIPVKYIESKIEIPEYFIFKNVSQGFFPINFTKTKSNGKINFVNKERTGGEGLSGVQTNFSTSQVNFTTSVTTGTASNIPAIKEEPFVNNINNYKTVLKYEHTSTKFPDSPIKFYNTTWEDVTKTIYKSSNFGGQLDKTSYFKEDLETLVGKTAPTEEKIVKIFQFVKSKIKWNGYYGKYVDKGVRKAYKDGTGNVAEVNLALVAMMREAGLNANPILVSTRKHGVPLFPTNDGFNYVIAGVEIQDNVILLDATEPYSFPNVLPLRDLNWRGRIIRENGSSASISLFPTKHTTENTFVNIELNSDGSVENGFKRVIYKNLNALNFRKKYNALSKDEFISKLEEKDDIEIIELKRQNENNISKPLIINTKFDREDNVDIAGTKMYISPLLFLTKKENPFKLEDRKFPVDFGAPWEDKCTISIKLPEGYKVESLPEKIAVGLPDNLGSFKFLISNKDNKIMVTSSTKINIPILSPDYYDALKGFYKRIIEKQAEKIILTRI